MHREHEVIDLGAASIETKGPFGQPSDEALGIPVGLSDD
jgi:hypothetical protein